MSSVKIGSGAGGFATSYKTAAFTAANNFNYLCNTTAGTFTATLPTGAAGLQIQATDDSATWATNPLVIAPASGQKIQGLNANDTLSANISGAFLLFSWDSTNSYWVVSGSGFQNVANATSTSPGLIPVYGNQFISVPSTSSNYSVVSGTQVGTTSTSTSTGTAVVTMSTSPMQLQANFKSVVTINWELWCGTALAQLYVSKGSNAITNAIQTSQRNFQANDLVRFTTTIQLSAGDTLYFGLSSGSPRADTTLINLNIIAQQIA